MMVNLLFMRHGLCAFVVGLLSFVMMFFIDIRPIRIELQSEREKAKIFGNNISTAATLESKEKFNPNEVIDFFVMAAQQNHITVQVVRVVEGQIGQIHWVATGTFKDVVNFLRLTNQVVMLKDFDWHVEKNSLLLMNADFLFVHSIEQKNVLQKKIVHNPFVIKNEPTALDLPEVDSEVSLSQLSIEQLRFVGSLLSQGKYLALLSDFSGKIWTVHVGAIVGKEQAVVVNLDSAGVNLKAKNRILRLN